MRQIISKSQAGARLTKNLLSALVAVLIPLTAAEARVQRVTLPKLEEVAGFGQVYYDLSGRKGLIVCFHGSGGSAKGWTKSEKAEFLEDLKQMGYSFVCPTSVNRSTKKWNAKNNFMNRDVHNVDGLLAHFGISHSTPLFLVGHSNGGGFASRYALLSQRTHQIKAVQYSNSAGLAPAFEQEEYTMKSLFNYAACDTVADPARSLANAQILESKTPAVRTLKNDVTAAYTGGDPKCHEFINTSATTAEFFRTGRNRGS